MGTVCCLRRLGIVTLRLEIKLDIYDSETLARAPFALLYVGTGDR
jgi:hypothetical protein